MTPTEKDSIAPGRRIRVGIRGRVFFARVTARAGDELSIDPEQPAPGTKGAKINYFSCGIGDIEWAEKNTAWSPYDAIRK